MRQCGDCQLCCKLLPVPPLQKKAGQRCAFQKFGKGCTVHHTPKMPLECGFWNCRWLVNDDAADLARPDRSHYVIDISPDFITTVDNKTGERHNIQVVQIWCDPHYPDAHRDPALRRWLFRRAEDGIAGLVRFNNKDAITIIAPPLNIEGQWCEVHNGLHEKTHSLIEIAQALAKS